MKQGIQRFLSVLFTISFLCGAILPVTPALAQVQSASVQTSSPFPRGDDPALDEVILKLFTLLKSLCAEVGGTCQKLFALISYLIHALQTYFAEISQQIQSSKCHNRSCSDYGTRTPIGPVTQTHSQGV